MNVFDSLIRKIYYYIIFYRVSNNHKFSIKPTIELIRKIYYYIKCNLKDQIIIK